MLLKIYFISLITALMLSVAIILGYFCGRLHGEIEYWMPDEDESRTEYLMKV